MNWGSGLAMGVVGALVGGGAMLLAQPTVAPGERGRIEGVVRAYLLANPEIIAEAIGTLQAREVGKVVTANRAALETPYAGAYAGNPRGDVTLVEFYDYSCGYCRTAAPDLDRLVREDPRLRVVYRELPVLGPNSEAAAYASLAAASANRFVAFHRALFAAGRPVPETLARVARASGVPVAANAAARMEIGRNVELARAVGITGTPGYVVGGQVFAGAVGYDVLKKAIAEARTGRR